MSDPVQKTQTPAKPRKTAAKTAVKSAGKTASAAKPKTSAKAGSPQPPAPTQPAPSQPSVQPVNHPSHQQVADLAYHFWQQRGGQHGHHHQDWLRAEHELRKP